MNQKIIFTNFVGFLVGGLEIHSHVNPIFTTHCAHDLGGKACSQPFPIFLGNGFLCCRLSHLLSIFCKSVLEVFSDNEVCVVAVGEGELKIYF